MKHFNDLSIRVKLISVFLVLALVPMLIVATISYQYSSNALTELAKNELQFSASVTAEDFTTFLGLLRNDVLIFGDLPPVQGIIRARDNDGIDPNQNDTYQDWVNRLSQIFATQARNRKFYQQIRFLDENGKEMVRVDYRDNKLKIIPQEEMQDKGDQPYFLEAKKMKQGQVYISALNLNREHGEIEVPYVPVIRFATPIYDVAEQFRGVVVSNVYATNLFSRLRAEESTLYWANEAGYWLYHPDDTKTFGFDLGNEYKVDDEFSQEYQELEQSTADSYVELDTTRGEIIVLQHVHFDPDNPERRFLFIKTMPQQELLGVVNQLGILVAEVSIGIMVLVVVFAILFTRILTRQITFITETFAYIKNGDLTKRTQITGRDELGQMAKGLNNLLDQLVGMFQKTETERTHLHNTVIEYVDFAKKVSEGDLSTRLSLQGNGRNSDDPLITLGHNLNNMIEKLREITIRAREATTNISSATSQILAVTSEQVNGANQQSAAITQTTATISQVRMVVEQTFNKAEAVSAKAKRTSEISYTGQQAVTETIENMNQIKERVAGIAENILALSEQTQQIGEITATVNEIASQSNLLALNASVEAARAGEHGKGFAVVAVEVRNLAEQSKQATAQVKAILDEIQRATNAAVMATEEGTKGVDTGVNLTQQAGNTIMQLAQNITESADMAQQIVVSAQQQTTGMEQITLAMKNINQATTQSLASIRQTEQSVQDLSHIARQLENIVSEYKLN